MDLDQIPLSERIKVWWDNISIITKIVFSLCCLVYLIELFGFPKDQITICFSSFRVIQNFAYSNFLII
jgi:hypothetical protein